MPKKFDQVYLQKRVIEFIAAKLPPQEIYAPVHGTGQLERILREARDQIFPQATTRTLRVWWQYFLLNGECKAVTDKRENFLARRYKRKSTRGRWRKRNTTKLQQIVDANPQFFLDEIQEEFLRRTGEFWSQSMLWKKLVSECNYSLQVATDRSMLREQKEIDEYQQQLRRKVSNVEQLVFVDESAKDRNSSRRRRSWSKRGLTPFLPSYLASRDATRYTLIAACDVNGFIMEACETVERERGDADADPTRGTVDGERYKLWVEERFVPILGDYSKGEPRSVVVMDNASVHHVDGIEEAILATGATIIYTARYAPEYNPIEPMFHIYKSKLRRLRGQCHWIDAHIAALESVSPSKARAEFRHAQVPGAEHFTDESLSKKEEEALVFASAAIVCVLRSRKRKRKE